MKYKEILESPIDDIKYHGDFDYSKDEPGNSTSTYSPGDKKLVKNENYKIKLFKAFQKTPFHFIITFVDLPKEDLFFNINDLDFANEILAHEGISHNSITFKNVKIDAKPDAITVVLLHNLKFETPATHLPLTPWIVAHKIGHAIDSGNQEGPTTLKEMYKNFRILFTEITENYSRKQIFTFKSSKADVILETEMLVELIAQYLIQGKITLNKNIQDIDTKQIEELETKLNKELYKIFSSLNGYILTAV